MNIPPVSLKTHKMWDDQEASSFQQFWFIFDAISPQQQKYLCLVLVQYGAHMYERQNY